MIFPITKTKYNILKIIYQEEEITISKLIKITKADQLSAYTYIKELITAGIIQEQLIGRKPILRILRPNLNSEEGILAFSLIEAEKNKDFFEKHKELKGAFTQFTNEIKELSLIFGSFSKGAATKDSDIDIAIIGEHLNSKRIESIAEKCFVTLKNRASVRLFTKKDFVNQLAKKDPFITQIQGNHIILSNYTDWVILVGQLV